MGFYNPIYKNELFFLPKSPFTQDIYMAFYLLTWTYSNDVNVGRNILINSQLKRIFFYERRNKTEKDRKNMKIIAMKVTSVKIRCQI